MEIVADDFIKVIAECSDETHTDPKKFDNFGLVLVANWTPSPEFKPKYQELIDKLKSIDDCIYVYPFRSLHCTVATFVSFKQTNETTESQKAECLEACNSALKKFVESGIQLKPFTLQVEKAHIEKAACFFTYKNPGNEIEEIRKVVANTCFPFLKEHFGEERYSKLLPNIPKIIHTTFARFKYKPSQDRVEKIYQEASKLFEGFSSDELKVTDLYLAIEYIPYMHIPKESDSIAFHVPLN